jgi:hypothetical protein
MSFFQNKVSQNDWDTIMPLGPVTLMSYWPKQIFAGQPKASLPNNLHVHKYIFSNIGDRLKIVKFIRGISDEHQREVINTSALNEG